MDAFPAFVPLRGARVVVVGTGEAADAKARLFDGSPATLVRVEATAALDPETYRGAQLAFIALEGEAAGRAAAAARAAGALVNAVDRPELSDFYTPSIVDRGGVVGAIGTAGQAPLLAARLRAEIETRWPERLGDLARLFAALKDELRAALPQVRARRAALARILDGPAAAAALAGDRARALRLAREAVSSAASPGEVVRVTAPLDPDLLTVRDLRVLARADRLIAGPEIDAALLAHARRDAPRAASASAAQLADWSAQGETVVVVGAAASA